jgi:preprotein translocase subunit SecG
MHTVLLIVHLLIALALVGVILLQRSEGGALGIGGGGGNLFTGRGSANLLTRTTAGLAAGFVATSMLLAIVSSQSSAPRSILDQPAPSTTAPAAPETPAEPAEPSAPLAQ